MYDPLERLFGAMDPPAYDPVTDTWGGGGLMTPAPPSLPAPPAYNEPAYPATGIGEHPYTHDIERQSPAMDPALAMGADFQYQDPGQDAGPEGPDLGIRKPKGRRGLDRDGAYGGSLGQNLAWTLGLTALNAVAGGNPEGIGQTIAGYGQGYQKGQQQQAQEANRKALLEMQKARIAESKDYHQGLLDAKDRQRQQAFALSLDKVMAGDVKTLGAIWERTAKEYGAESPYALGFKDALEAATKIQWDQRAKPVSEGGLGIGGGAVQVGGAGIQDASEIPPLIPKTEAVPNNGLQAEPGTMPAAFERAGQGDLASGSGHMRAALGLKPNEGAQDLMAKPAPELASEQGVNIFTPPAGIQPGSAAYERWSRSVLNTLRAPGVAADSQVKAATVGARTVQELQRVDLNEIKIAMDKLQYRIEATYGAKTKAETLKQLRLVNYRIEQGDIPKALATLQGIQLDNEEQVKLFPYKVGLMEANLQAKLGNGTYAPPEGVAGLIAVAGDRMMGADAGEKGCARAISWALGEAGVPVASASAADLEKGIRKLGQKAVRVITNPADLQPGDVVFVDGNGPSGRHAMMVNSAGQIIGAPGVKGDTKVRVQGSGSHMRAYRIAAPAEGKGSGKAATFGGAAKSAIDAFRGLDARLADVPDAEVWAAYNKLARAGAVDWAGRNAVTRQPNTAEGLTAKDPVRVQSAIRFLLSKSTKASTAPAPAAAPAPAPARTGGRAAPSASTTRPATGATGRATGRTANPRRPRYTPGRGRYRDTW